MDARYGCSPSSGTSCGATSRDRLIVDGDLPTACGMLTSWTCSVLLLPKFAAKLGVALPKWSRHRRSKLQRQDLVYLGSPDDAGPYYDNEERL